MKKILKNILIGFLTYCGKRVIKRQKPFIIAITGSVGKTSTKEVVSSIFDKDIRKSLKKLQ